MTWAPGDVIVLREVLGRRVRSARPLVVVEDGPEALVGFLAPRSRVAWPRLVDERQSQTPDQGWRLVPEEWRGPGCLFVLPTGEAFAAVHYLERDADDPGGWRPSGWKVDFLAPPRRHPLGLDTLDWALDLLVSPDLASVTVKDGDDLAQLELVGLLDEDAAGQVRAARRRAEALVAARAAPFTGRWADWRPPVDGAAASCLPPGWDRLVPPGPASGAAAPSSPAVRAPSRWGGGRSAAGTRLLDEHGRTFLDLDLAGGSLLHGHAHPRIVEAITRQAPLGLGASTGDGLTGLLAARLADRFEPVEGVLWTGSGAEAWWAAVRVARRWSGRRRVAWWTVVPGTGLGDDDVAAVPEGGDHDDDLVVVSGTSDALTERLAAGDERWAAVVVDPLALAVEPAPGGGGSIAQRSLALLPPATLVIADERRTLGAGPGGGHPILGVRADLVVFGAALFGGLGGGALGGRRDVLVGAGGVRGGPPAGRRAPRAGGAGGPSSGPTPGGSPLGGVLHPVLAAAGLATLELAGPAALDDLSARAARLRSASGLAGFGAAIRLPPGATGARLAGRGVLVDRTGWAWLATVSGDAEVEEALHALAALP